MRRFRTGFFIYPENGEMHRPGGGDRDGSVPACMLIEGSTRTSDMRREAVFRNIYKNSDVFSGISE